jgi:large conductance mechanosensitive channel
MAINAGELAGRGKALGNEFRQFLSRGNVLDMAVGVIIGGAFGKIVSSLVGDVIMPPLGLLLAKVDFKELKWVIQPAGKDSAEIALGYGRLIQATVDFLIIGFVIFLAVKFVTRLSRKPEGQPTTKECAACTLAIPIKATRCPNCTSELKPA